MTLKIEPPVLVRKSILHAHYIVADVGHDTVVYGVSTAILADRFRAGEDVGSIATDYGMDDDDVIAALRWELHPRETRVAAVRRQVLDGQA